MRGVPIEDRGPRVNFLNTLLYSIQYLSEPVFTFCGMSRGYSRDNKLININKP